MDYRTDLALERSDILEEKRRMGGPAAEGYIRKESRIDEDISITHIQIISEEGEKAFGKPQGNYITVEVNGILEGKDEIRQRASRALAGVLKGLIPFH